MKKLIKLLDILLAVGGAVSLGILMEFVISSIDDDGLGFLAAAAISIVGAGILIASVILIWVAASGELKASKSKQHGLSEVSEPSDKSDNKAEAVIASSDNYDADDVTEIE